MANNEISLIIGKRIANARKKKGLRQNELAEALGIKQNRLSNWEVGVTPPRADQIVSLTQILGVSSDYLLGIAEDGNDVELSYSKQQLIEHIKSASTSEVEKINQILNIVQSDETDKTAKKKTLPRDPSVILNQTEPS